MRLLMIDNYDSFTFNLVQYLGELGAEVEVVRNDALPLDEMRAREPAGASAIQAGAMVMARAKRAPPMSRLIGVPVVMPSNTPDRILT